VSSSIRTPLLHDRELLQRTLDAAMEEKTIQGTAAKIGVSRKTISRYRRDYPRFAALMDLALGGHHVQLPDDYLPTTEPSATPPAGAEAPVVAAGNSHPTIYPASYSTLLRDGAGSPREHLQRLQRIVDDECEDSALRVKALDSLNKFYLGPALAEQAVIAERVGKAVDIGARIRRLENEAGLEVAPELEEGDDSAQAGPLVFAAIPANGSEAPGHGPADVIDIELAPGEAS
jgi:hypothetical protein